MITSDVYKDPRGTPGFRQYDPGVWTNDTGKFWDATGRQITDPTIKKPPIGPVSPLPDRATAPPSKPAPTPTAIPWMQYDPGVWQQGNQFSLSPTGSNPTTREAWLATHPNDKDVFGIGGQKPAATPGPNYPPPSGQPSPAPTPTSSPTPAPTQSAASAPVPTGTPPPPSPQAPGVPNMPPYIPHTLTTPAPDLTNAFQTGISGGLVPNPSDASRRLSNLLAQRATQSLAINPLTDPIIAPQINAAAATYDRAARNTIDTLAESNSPYATGALNTARTQAGEFAGQQTAALQAQLVQNELTARRAEIQDALAQSGNLLTADQQLALQRQLAMVNSALSKYQIQGGFELGNQGQNNALQLGLLNTGIAASQAGNQNQQFYAGLGEQARQFGGTLGLQQQQLAQQGQQFYAGLGLQQRQMGQQNQQFYAGLSQQGQQFLNNLAFQYAGLGASTGIQQQQMNQQNAQFYAGLSTQDKQFLKNLELQYGGQELQRRQLAQQNQQFYAGLGSQNDQFLAQLGLTAQDRANYWDAIRRGLL